MASGQRPCQTEVALILAVIRLQKITQVSMCSCVSRWAILWAVDGPFDGPFDERFDGPFYGTSARPFGGPL